MVWRKKAEEEDVGAFEICLHNNNLVVQTDKHTDTHRQHHRYIHCVHTLQTSFWSQVIAPTVTLHSHRELFSCLTGSRGAVNRPELFKKQAALPRYTATHTHTH